MPNSSGAHDHNFGAIEAAVKETARGRAFLADYARKVRQSDTLTLLAMLGRLERWSQEQARRLAELEGRDPAFGGRASQGHASLAPGHRGEPAEQTIGPGEASLHANHLDVLAVTVRDQDAASVDRASGVGMDEAAGIGQSREAMDRIQHLANGLRDIDRRTSDLTGRRHTIGQGTDVGPSALVTSADNRMGAMISYSAASDARDQSSRDTADKTHALEEDVLDGIAKALGTRQTADGW
jgi:hypothetical protein